MFTFHQELNLMNATFYELHLKWDCVILKYQLGWATLPRYSIVQYPVVAVKVFYSCD